MENSYKEWLKLALLFTGAALLGSVTKQFFVVMFLFTLVLLLSQLAQIIRFERWIKAGGKGTYPKARGIWEDIYYHHYCLKKADRKRKKKFRKIIGQFRQYTEALPDAAVVLGDNDEIEWANKIAHLFFGLQPSDKGQRILNLIRYPDFIRYLLSGNFNEGITLPSPVNKHLLLSVRIIPYGNGLRLLLAQDVTQLKKMELMRKDFVANVSHELRTPLTVLKGYLETLQDLDEVSPSVLTNAFQQMHLQTERMQHLVDDLLLLTRLETRQQKSEMVDVSALLTQICREGEVIKRSAQRIELSLETSAKIQGDGQELRSAFTNLIENALKYSPEQSAVTVRWFQDKTDNVLLVEDQGEGIAAAHIPRITERFYRCEVKRSKSIMGTGLGLAIVKHVLIRHNARLQIVSTLHKGSCFSCHFPIKQSI